MSSGVNAFTGILLMATMLTFSGCNLARRTTKTTVKDNRTIEKIQEFNLQEWKDANKQTHIFTYWDSGSVYQFQQIKEQVAETKSTAAKLREKELAKQEFSSKQTSSLMVWIFVGVAVLFFTIYLLYRINRRK